MRWLTKAIVYLTSCDYGALIENTEMAVECADGFQKASNAVTERNAQMRNNHDIFRFLFSSKTHYFIRNSSAYA